VRACAEAGTHYVDLTGEPAFLELVRSRYHEVAKARRAKIVNACGFDSIPHDLGAYFTLMTLRQKLTPEEQKQAAVRIEGFVRALPGLIAGLDISVVEDAKAANFHVFVIDRADYREVVPRPGPGARRRR